MWSRLAARIAATTSGIANHLDDLLRDCAFARRIPYPNTQPVMYAPVATPATGPPGYWLAADDGGESNLVYSWSAFGPAAVTFATNWPLWLVCLGGALAVEVTIGIYALERRAAPGRAGLAMVALRLLMILAVTAMLCQPVMTYEVFFRDRQQARYGVSKGRFRACC